MKKIIIDDNIPFIKGRTEPFFETVYTGQFSFTPELVRDASAVIIRTRTRCDRELLGESAVRLVATATIGMDQIDIPWCEKYGITVRNAPGCNAPGVAQYVWSSLLRSGFRPECMTLGVVGCGNVGSIVADWGKKLGCRILVSDPPKEERGEECGFTYVPLDKLLAESDAVTLHTPLVKEGPYPSYHLIGEREIQLMKQGAFLVNAARGPVVDTAGVMPLIGTRVRGIFDTWEGEPELSRELLKRAEIATFHIAGYSDEGKQRATRMVLEAIEDEFGIPLDKSGLAPAYEAPETVDAETIVNSYNPFDDDTALRKNPELFDVLRASYHYRPEPVFNCKK